MMMKKETDNVSGLHKIKALVFDVDGVLTNGQVVLMPDGEQLRYMHTKDGYALQLAVRKGYIVAVITGGKSEAVRLRLKGLGLTDIYMGVSNKDEAMDDLIHSYSLDQNEILYMGDDIPDLPAMEMAGVITTPADGAPEVKQMADIIAKAKGGEGCVREIIEKVMRLHGKWYVHSDTPNHKAFNW